MIATAFVVAKAPGGRRRRRGSRRRSRPARPPPPQALLLDTVASCQAAARTSGCSSRATTSARSWPPCCLACRSSCSRAAGWPTRCGWRCRARRRPSGRDRLVGPSGRAGGLAARTAAALRDGADVVLGPAADGGYWLIAMRAAHDAPFRDIPWSTPAVWAVTLRRCQGPASRSQRSSVGATSTPPPTSQPCRRDRLRTRAANGGRARVTAGPGNDPDAARPVAGSSDLLAASPWRTVVATSSCCPAAAPPATPIWPCRAPPLWYR